MTSMIRRRTWGAALLALALAACGGGGGDGGSGSGSSDAPVGPPTSPATISATSADATEAVKAAVSGADGVATRYTNLTSFSALFGVAIAQGQAVPTAALRAFGNALPHPDRQRALDVSTVGCLDVVDGPCTGSAVFDTNIPSTANSVSAGQYLEVTFTNVSGYTLGVPVTMNGKLRIEFLTGANLSAAQLTSVSMRLKFVNLSGSANGVAYGPVNDLMDLALDSLGNSTLTSSGARYGTLDAVTVTGVGTYTIGTGDVRAAFGSSGGYADLSLSNWRSSAGRPVVGSLGTVRAGSSSATVRVTSSSTGTVVYAVSVTVGSSTTGYTVTATYAGSGSAPTYVAQPAG